MTIVTMYWQATEHGFYKVVTAKHNLIFEVPMPPMSPTDKILTRRVYF